MKLCILTHSYPRFEGDWRSNFIASLAEAYVKCGAAVTVCVPRSSLCASSAAEHGGVRVVRYRYAPHRALHTVGYGHSMRQDLRISLLDLALMPLLLAAGVVRFTRLLRRERFDLVHAHWALPSALIALSGRWLARSRAKVFVSFPGSDVTVLAKLGWLGRRAARVIARADYLSCNSADLKEDLVALGIPGERIDYALYGVDDARIRFTEPGRARDLAGPTLMERAGLRPASSERHRSGRCAS